MKAPTARQKAEAHVALIRARYPEPLGYSEQDWEIARNRPDGWYCVGAAAARFESARGIDIGFGPYTAAAVLNNRGRYEEAWAALVDFYERRFSREMQAA